MPGFALPVAAAALAALPGATAHEIVMSTRDGPVVRLSYDQLAEVSSRPPQDMSPMLSTPDQRRPGSDFAWSAGVRTIAISSSVGSVVQAETSLNVLMRFSQSGP